MSKVGTDKKLELIRAIRMQNHYDRQLFRSRENFLYSDNPSQRHGEIYSLEAYGMDAGAYPAADGSLQKTANDKTDGSLLKGFRVRFVIAMVLFLAFVYCDMRNIKIGGQSTETLYQMILDTQIIPQLTNLFQ